MTVLPAFFVLGAYVQDAGHMQSWKDRGLNTMVEAPDGADLKAWSAAAWDLGLYQIRAPIVTPSSTRPLTSAQLKALVADASTKGLLAWSQPDEPSNTQNNFAKVAYTPAQLEAMAKQLRSASSTMPIWENHVGGHITPDWALTIEPRWHKQSGLMQDYMQGPEADWLASDTYQIQNGQPLIQTAVPWDGSGAPSYVSTPQGIAEDRQTAWSTDGTWASGKPVMSFIATSAYGGASQPVPTEDQFNVQAWSSVIHGATGIIYFPVQLSPWAWDTTPPALVDAITSFSHEIAGVKTSTGAILYAGINDILIKTDAADPTKSGGTNSHTIYRSAVESAGADITQLPDHQLPYGLEASVIDLNGVKYRIILNMTDTTKVLTLNMLDPAQKAIADDLGLTDGRLVLGRYEVTRGYHFATGDVSNNTLTATNGSTTMKGCFGDDTLNGGAGDDTLDGGQGSDLLTGGAGKDAFVFHLDPTNGVDTVTDFQHGTDRLVLDHVTFSGFGGSGALGILKSSMFVNEGDAVTASTRIIAMKDGSVMYDADGSGTNAAPIKIAVINEPGGTHSVTASDFFII